MKQFFLLLIVFVFHQQNFAAYAPRIKFHGEISKELVSKFLTRVQKKIDQGHQQILVDFDSTGGNLQAAFRAISSINLWQKNGIHFYFQVLGESSSCDSACLPIFVQGNSRLVSNNASFYVHPLNVRRKLGSKVTQDFIVQSRQLWQSKYADEIAKVSRSFANYLLAGPLITKAETFSGYDLKLHGVAE